MRFAAAVPTRDTTGLTADVYEMVVEDGFINVSITRPEALAPYKVEESVVRPVLCGGDQALLFRSVAWATMTGTRRIASDIATANPELHVEPAGQEGSKAA